MDTKKIFLLPGEMCLTTEPTEITTILGSCVGLCLFDRRQKFGGMNHYMLPDAPTGEKSTGKHGLYSTETLIKMMLAKSKVADIDAVILGGGNVTGHLSVGTGIGERNIIVAWEMVKKYSLHVVRHDTGGNYGRKIWFHNWDGELEVRPIEKSALTLQLEERKKHTVGRKIRVLVVDDSATIRTILTDAINSDPLLEVIGGAANPFEARELLLEQDPDVICLDIIMPKMDGITFLKKLFEYKPKPVIIISTVAQKGSKLREQAQKIGAVEVIDKEDLRLYEGLDVVKLILNGKIKAASAALVHKKSREELEAI